MKKILYICSSLERCGPTNQLLNILNNLKHDIDCHIVTLSIEPSSSMMDEFTFVKKTCISNLNFFKKIIFLANMAKDFDIIHTQGIRADIISSLLFKNSVSTLRNYPYDDYPPLYGKIKGNLMAFLHLLALKRIKIPITVSESNKNKLSKITRTNFHVIYNGVELDKYKRKKNSKFNPNKLKLVFAGPLIERKRVDRLIYILDKVKNIDLIILGDGPLMPALAKNKYNNIHLLGQTNNVQEYLQESDAFIMLSASEGMPNAALEALAVGIPCILSNIEPHVDLQSIVGEHVKVFNTDQQVIDFLSFDFINYLNHISTINNNGDDEYRFKISAERMASDYLSIYLSIFTSH